MKQFVILSGKGGAGKTSLTAALAHLAATDPDPVSLVIIDADVDAANLELVLAPNVLYQEEFWGGQIATIDAETCEQCGICKQVCRFDAIFEYDGGYSIDPIACEGCATCFFQCPSGAVTMSDQRAGTWFHSESRFGPLIHAALQPAQENSGKLIAKIRQHARTLAVEGGYDLILIDGPPGIGCPVISAVTGADLALIVAEPSMAGMHDMRRALQTTKHFGIQSLVCVNKSDLYPKGTAEIETYCCEHQVEMVGQIPFDAAITMAMMQGEPVTRYRPDASASHAISTVWDCVKEVLVR